MKNKSKRRGMAMILTLISLITIAGTLAVVMVRVQGSKTNTDHAVDDIILDEAARSGIDWAVEQLWNDYLASSGSTTDRNWASYRYYLDNTLALPINEDLNGNGEQDPNEVGNGDNDFEVADGYDYRGKLILDAPKSMADPETAQEIASLDSVYVSRYDTVFESYLTVRATASRNGKSRTAVQVLQIGSGDLVHTQFAVLANNINCILCHAEFLSLDLERNDDADQYGDFDRVKIAALESLLVRKSGADSQVAGTVYTRGQVYDNNGAPYTPAALASNSFQGYAFDNTDGTINQNDSGDMSTTALIAADTTGDGYPEQFANLYMDYPTESGEQTDGPLPESFPAPYPDENDNRIVDDSEFDVITNTANGTIDFEHGDGEDNGAISAGIAYGVPAGDLYMGDGLPTNSNSALTSLKNTGTYEGNLILVGTEDDPIKIDHAVAIDGDLVIQGPIEGEGLLQVRGNVYITGDTTYADAAGEFGVNENGDTNAFGLVAGGSIFVGDYLTVRGVNDSGQNNKKYPNKKYSIKVRKEHKTKSVNGETLEYGYYDDWSVDPNEEVVGRQGQQFSFTQSELQLFNNLELDKALADSNYVPRFYGLREGQPDNVYVYHGEGSFNGDEHSVRYSETGVRTIPDYLAQEGYSTSEINSLMDRSTIHYCNPSNNWISEDTLRNVWYEDEMSRPSSYRPFKFDGLMYSNNSIFAIVRSKGRHGSYSNGKMDLRGGVIAADLGVFVPGGLDLMYDPRVERFLANKDDKEVQFTRAAFYFEYGEEGAA